LQVYKNIKVIVTGSTGFKGSWLCFWLHLLNAKIIGLALRPEKDSIIFKKLSLSKKIKQIYLDINNFKKLNEVIKKEKPDIIFHLAAQSIVSLSYLNPLKTIMTNVIGSSNILECVRINKIKNLVYITSDKCYKNDDRTTTYSEDDILGGEDPYLEFQYQVTSIDGLLSSGTMMVEYMPLPDDFELSQAYPNPFNPVTTLQYALPLESDIVISVHDMQGRLVTYLANGLKSAGYYEADWNASNHASGMYFIRMNVYNSEHSLQFSKMQKIILVK